MIKMNNLKGAENSHRVLPTFTGADYAKDEAIISDFREIFLSTPESIKIFHFNHGERITRLLVLENKNKV